MKKMNNKGFAISTVIYGLSIMGILIVSILMGIMSTTRANNRELSKTIEEELNRFSRTETTFTAVNDTRVQEYAVPAGEAGWYRIELWGAQGGPNGGLGAYTSGIIELEEGEELYFSVGKHNKSTTSSGESTDVRVVSGAYNSKTSYSTRIMVAAGGGSSAGASGGTLYGYTKDMTPTGGKVRTYDTTDSKGDFLLEDGSTLIGTPTSYTRSSVIQSGEPQPHQSSGTGGDGYFSSNNSNIGGVSFISGYAGSRAYYDGTLQNKPTYIYKEAFYDEETDSEKYDSGKPYYFYDGIMIAGVNKGDGRAKIERIAKKTETFKELPRKNKKMNNVKYIRDCLSTENPNIGWSSIQAISNGENKVSSMSDESIPGYKCKRATLSAASKLDEIAVWHSMGKDNDYINHTIAVSSDGVNWAYVKAPTTSGETKLSETETVNGIRISAYQPDYTTKLPDSGNYYIIPVLAENKVITAQPTIETDSNPLSINYLSGSKRQVWSIEKVDEKVRNSDQEYKLVESIRFKALSIYMDENKLGNQVCAAAEFNRDARNEISIWKLVSLGNGTYRIETVTPMFDESVPTGNLCPKTYIKNEDPSAPDASKDMLLISPNKAPNDTQRFKLIALDSGF